MIKDSIVQYLFIVIFTASIVLRPASCSHEVQRLVLVKVLLQELDLTTVTSLPAVHSHIISCRPTKCISLLCPWRKVMLDVGCWMYIEVMLRLHLVRSNILYSCNSWLMVVFGDQTGTKYSCSRTNNTFLNSVIS
jgi:hypothetical protein